MFGLGKKKRRKMNEEEKNKPAEEVVSDSVNPETETAQEPASEAETAPETEPVQDATSDSGSEEPAAAEPNWKDQYARLLADFDNSRKRVARDREELAQFAAKDILKDLLSTVDNLALALEKAENKEDPFVQGVKLAYDGFLKALADHGATPLDSVGEPFDTNFHDALAQLPSSDVAEGIVMNEVKRGWLLHGKLLRPAQVVVSSGAPAQPAEA